METLGDYFGKMFMLNIDFHAMNPIFNNQEPQNVVGQQAYGVWNQQGWAVVDNTKGKKEE